MTQASDKILLSKGEIMKYLKCSQAKLEQLIREGLPVKKIAGGFAAHVENLDVYFKKITGKE